MWYLKWSMSVKKKVCCVVGSWHRWKQTILCPTQNLHVNLQGGWFAWPHVRMWVLLKQDSDPASQFHAVAYHFRRKLYSFATYQCVSMLRTKLHSLFDFLLKMNKAWIFGQVGQWQSMPIILHTLYSSSLCNWALMLWDRHHWPRTVHEL